MNKLFALILLTLVGSSCATNPFSEIDDEDFSAVRLMPDDDIETGSLQGNYRMFADYCIQSRDEIKRFLKESTSGAAANVFDALFSNFGEVGDELINAQQSAVTEASELIRNNAVAPEPTKVAESKEEVQEDLEKSIENVSLYQVVKSAVKTVINAVIETAQTQVFQKLAVLRAKFSGETLKEMVANACQSVQYELQKKLDSMLATTKNSIRSASVKNPALKDPAIAEMLAKAKPETVGCVSTSRVNKIARFCDIFRMAGPTIFPMLGM